MKRFKQILTSKHGGFVIHGIGLLVLLIGYSLFQFVFVANIESKKLAQAQRMSQLKEFIQSRNKLCIESDQLEKTIDTHSKRDFGLITSTGSQKEIDPTVFVDELTGWATQKGLSVESFDQGAIEEFEDFQRVQVKLSAKGSYDEFCRFSSTLNELNRVVRIKKLVVNTSNDSADLKVYGEFLVYYGFAFTESINEMAGLSRK